MPAADRAQMDAPGAVDAARPPEAEVDPGQAVTPAVAPVDIDELPTNVFDPLVPRAIDLPTPVPLDASLDPEVGDIAKILAAPDDPAEWPAWRDALVRYRDETRIRLADDGAVYERDGTRWASTAYSVSLVSLWDERLYDREAHRFDVAGYLAKTRALGGFDGVVLWHAYPAIGIDDRNQFDWYREVPGLGEVVAAFHDAGVKVFLDYNPWDTGTRRAAHDDATELVDLAIELGADGVFLDTLKEGDPHLVETVLGADPPLVIEGESRVPNARLRDHQLSWAQWFADSAAPGVMRAHWLERRHMLHATRRWNRDHSDELQSAFMNGTGLLAWEDVFGVWVGWNARDTSVLRRMLRVQRALSDVLLSGEWTPLVDATPDAVGRGVYASRWELGGLVLWTVVNRGGTDATGAWLEPDALGAADAVGSDGGSGAEWFELTTGGRLGRGRSAPEFTVPARGVAAVLAVRDGEPPWLAGLLAEAAADPHDPDATFPAREPVRVPAPRSKVAPPADAVPVAAGAHELTIAFRRRETGGYADAPYVEEWKPLPPRLHDPRSEQHVVVLDQASVGRTEVTNAEFADFLTATGYRPAEPNRFLPGWSQGVPVAGTGSHPVTGIDLDDARAYAAWTGARLPTEWEWQIAARQDGFDRLSPAVWNWTESEHTDGVARFVMLKGGAEHRATGSDWYVDGGVQEPEFSLKFVLPVAGLERSPSIGFRLAWDAP